MDKQAWIKYNMATNPPGWGPGEGCRVRLRDGRVQEATQPWLFAGWNHTGGNNDIMEYIRVPAPKGSK